MKIHDAWTGVIPSYEHVYREREIERERFTMLHSSSCRNTHWNPPQPSCRQRKESERNRELQQEEKWEEEIFTVSVASSNAHKPTQKIFCPFLSFLHSSSPPPSCFLWACKCQTAVTTALSLLLDLLLSLQGLLHAAEAEAQCFPTIRYGLPSIPSLSDWCWVRVEERGNGRGNDGNRLLSGRQHLKPLTPPRRYKTSMQKWSGDRE